MIEYEQKFWKDDQFVCGIDEVGRGPIAGPLVVCGVILKKNYQNDNIKDSKLLTEKKRLLLFDEIINNAVSIEIEIINEKTIDQLNILSATKLAMENISNKVDCHCLVDAVKLKNTNTTSIIKGDTISISIAAASIIAKVIRDSIMLEFDLIYPKYEFIKNKGYPTKKHKQAVFDYGFTKLHRKSFNPIKSLLMSQ